MAPRRIALTICTALGILSPLLPQATSSADPRPSLQQVQARIDALNERVGLLNEDYTGSRLDLSAARRNASIAQARVRRAQAELNRVQHSMQSLAASAYKTGGQGAFVQLVSTSSPQTFLDRMSSLNWVAAGQGAQFAAAQTARHRLDQQRQQASREQAQVEKIAAALEKQKSAIENALAEQTRLLGSLRAEDRQRLLAQRAAERARADAAARASRSRKVVEETYNGPASGRAAVAVREAYRKLGSPYKWAAAGPDRFDCSGLTMWVWAKAGVSLPHQSRAQYAGGRKVSVGDIRPGDLTFYGSPIHHVGIYIGGGRMISAPQTGDVVKISNAMRDDLVGVVRP